MSNPNNKTLAPDDPSSAPESGDVLESGRNRGQVVEPGGTIAKDAIDQSEEHTGDEFESGRQDAAPRTGA
jgi:hypothetical protein